MEGAVKIRKDSWHFKYVASMWDTRPRSLCWYFWKVVLTILAFYIVGGALAIAAAGIALYLLAVPVTGWFINLKPGADWIGGAVWVVIWAVCQFQYRQHLYATGRLTRKRTAYTPPKEPGLVAQYIEAKHRKICPLLEYERRW